MTNVVSELVLKLKDDVSQGANAVASSLEKVAGSEKKVGAASTEMNKLTDALDRAKKAASAIGSFKDLNKTFVASRQTFNDATKRVKDLSAAMTAVDKPTKAMAAAYRQAQREVKSASTEFDRQTAAVKQAKAALEGFDISINKIASAETRLKSSIETATQAIKRQADAEKAAAVAAEISQRRRAVLGGLLSGAAIYAGQKTSQAVHASLHTYREFDKERRFGKAVMGLTDEEQKPLVDQAIHMGATTKYNDIKVLEAQRELAARGVSKTTVMGMMPSAANLGMALDLQLPDAVKQMEGAIFGFKKDISTLDAALRSARQTADVQVKAAKISGMTPEDITQAYKYGATPARMAGVSEQMLLAFAGISKKANMGGDESGVAFRALIAAANSPTRGAKEAMLANGLNYKNYQKNPDHLAVDPFVQNVAAQYGVKLNAATQKALGKIFSDKSIISDPAKFTPAVLDVLGKYLGKNDAKSKRSIAGMANRYRNSSMEGVDTNAFIADLLKKIPGNLQLANAIFGAKQGSRIANALGDPETLKHMIEALTDHSEGYAEKIADERMSGFDGAVSRFEGATKNLESAIGRAFDAEGKGGLLTQITQGAANLVQGISELNPKILAWGSAIGTAVAKLSEFAGAFRIVDELLAFKSATALSAAARELSAAATRIGGMPGGVVPGVGVNGALKNGAPVRGPGLINMVMPAVSMVSIAADMATINSAKDFEDRSRENAKRDATINEWLIKNIPGFGYMDQNWRDQNLIHGNDKTFAGTTNPMDPFPDHGLHAGSKTGESIAAGLISQLGTVQSAAAQIMKGIELAFAGGVTVPVKMAPSGIAGMQGLHADFGIGGPGSRGNSD